ncbi:MAG: hypothetical protein ABSG64_00290 [Solirubrobacteraceae bacterium]|jgi:hypothetical protein
MDMHPLVRFADGPAGRRTRLVGGGLDMWEVIATVRDNDGDVAESASYLELPVGLALRREAARRTRPDATPQRPVGSSARDAATAPGLQK